MSAFKKKFQTNQVGIQAFLDKFLSKEKLLAANVDSIENDASFVIITTAPSGPNNEYYEYRVNKKSFVEDFLVPSIPGIKADEIVSFTLNGTNIDVFIEFEQISKV